MTGYTQRLTPRITRRPETLLQMTARVSAVACMRLLDGVTWGKNTLRRERSLPRETCVSIRR